MNNNILIATLYCGENELEQCIGSIKQQSHKNWEHIIFKNLPNKEAHYKLYKAFMDNSKEFDYFIKLDADMVFNTDKALEIILDIFKYDSSLDHLEMAVDDRFSDSLIMGVHTFSKRAKWVARDENLFVDYKPKIPGKHKYLWKSPAPLVEHCPNPSKFQAYHFGVHRAIKAFQKEQSTYNLIQAKAQWDTLNKVWLHFTKTKNPKLGFAILGAEQVIQNLIKQEHCNYQNPYLREYFKQFENLTASELYEILKFNWNSMLARSFRYWKDSVLTSLPKIWNGLLNENSNGS